MSDDDYWKKKQITDEYNQNAKDHLSPKFNQQDAIKLEKERIKKLNADHLKAQKEQRKPPSREKTLKPSKGYMKDICDAVDRKVALERELKVKKRMEEIKKEIEKSQERIKEIEKQRSR